MNGIVEENSLKDQTDEALAVSAKHGDDEALTTLISRYVPMVRLRARVFLQPELDEEDLFQEGMIALLKAVRNYRENGSGSFRTFAAVCVNNKLSSALTAYFRHKNAPMREYVSLNGERLPEDPALTDGADPEALVIQSEEAKDRSRRIQNLLSLFERQVLKLYLSSYSYDEMASQLGSSVKAVDNALQRVRRKLRGSFQKE